MDYNPIVPLNVTGSKTPIFMIHPGSGDTLAFVNLAKYFQNDRPFYAFRARGFESGQPVFASMDEITSSYTSAVKLTQPHGPYAIAGYSFGGVVAFEVAKRLEAMGDEVKFIGLIDVLPDIAHRMREIDWTGGMLNLSTFLGFVWKQKANKLAPSLRLLPRQEQLDAVWQLALRRVSELQLTSEQFGRWADVVGSLAECGKQYHPSGSVCMSLSPPMLSEFAARFSCICSPTALLAAVDVFYAAPPRGSKKDEVNQRLKGWSEFCRGQPTYNDVPGQHFTLLDAKHVPEFQRIFRNCLEARDV